MSDAKRTRLVVGFLLLLLAVAGGGYVVYEPGMFGTVGTTGGTTGTGSDDALKAHIELAGAKELLLSGKYDEARQIFTRIAKERPGTPQGNDAILRLADCNVLSGRPKDAILGYQQLIDGDDSIDPVLRARARIGLAEASAGIGKRDESLQQLEAVVLDMAETVPSMASESLMTMARLYRKEGQYGLARATYARVIEDHPGDEGAAADDATAQVEELGDIIQEKLQTIAEQWISANQVTEVSSIDSGTVRWSRDNGTYVINEVLTIGPGTTLIIEPGVEVRFAVRGGLMVQGTLKATGTADLPIRFVPLAGDAAQTWWHGIEINADSGQAPSELTHARIDGAEFAVNVDNGTANLDACEITNAHVCGLYVWRDGRLTARACRVTDSYRGVRCEQRATLRLEGAMIASYHIGVTLSLGPDASIRDSVVENCRGAGIWIRDAMLSIDSDRVCEVVDSTIRNNHGDGILCQSGSSARVAGNVIEGNQGVGIVYKDRSSPEVDQNRIRNNTRGGISIHLSRGGRIAGNRIENNGGPGVLCGLGSKPLIRDNLISKNKDGVLIDEGGEASLTGNDLSNNEGAPLRNHAAAVIDAKRNFWGTSNPAEIAQRIEDTEENGDWGQVTYQPFLPAAPQFGETSESP